MLHKIVVFQAKIGRRLSLDEKILIFKQRPDFVCLPEYMQISEDIPDFPRAALACHDHLQYLADLSDELNTCLVGGTVVEAVGDRLYNACYVFDHGREAGKYYKRYPVPGEQARGIYPGDETVVMETGDLRIGLMVCGDVFEPTMFDELRAKDADIVFIPTTSPYRPGEPVFEKHERDNRYFLAGAKRSGALVAKSCAVGKLFGKPLQGRSLVTAPWGIIKRVDPENENKVRMLSVTFDADELREFRRRLGSGSAGNDRRPAMPQPLKK